MLPETEELNGSPHNESCTTTYPTGTANILSTSKLISRTAGNVPLFLVPQVISREIHASGKNVTGVKVRRTRGHQYQITIFESPVSDEIRE